MRSPGACENTRVRQTGLRVRHTLDSAAWDGRQAIYARQEATRIVTVERLCRASVESMAESLRDLCRSELGYAPELYSHPALPECIILPPKLNRGLANWSEPVCSVRAACLWKPLPFFQASDQPDQRARSSA